MKEWTTKYNSFNSLKALVHVKYWEQVKQGIIPPPIFVSIDPCGACNLHCPHCNAENALSKSNNIMSNDLIDKIVKTLNVWGTKAICIAGGGEPLLSRGTDYLINKLSDYNKSVAVITNGTIVRDLETLLRCEYIGVSVDAATNQTWQKMKGNGKDTLDLNQVFNNIRKLSGKGTEITYKYLLLPGNHHEVYEACRIAKDLGCDQLHMRPGGVPWFGGKKDDYSFTPLQQQYVSSQIELARADFECDTFKIYGILHKFSDSWEVKNTFDKCWACYTTGYFSSDGRFGLCCDRRGDEHIMLCNIDDCIQAWGNDKHKQIHNSISINECPRCTYSVINEIFEHVILKDTTLYNFF